MGTMLQGCTILKRFIYIEWFTSLQRNLLRLCNAARPFQQNTSNRPIPILLGLNTSTRSAKEFEPDLRDIELESPFRDSSISSLLQPAFDDIIDTGLWLAAPKNRTSRIKKRMKNRNKFLKNREDIETCVVCGNTKLIGHLCGHCYSEIKRETASVRKALKD